MGLDVEMNKDIRDTAPKIIGPFNRRQLVCILIGLCYSVPVFFLLGLTGLSVSIRIVIGILFMAPAVACGWAHVYGMPLEQFALHIIRTRIFGTTIRICAQQNIFEELNRQIEQEELEKSIQEALERKKAEKHRKRKMK